MPLLNGRGRADIVGFDGEVEHRGWTTNLVTRAGLDHLGELLIGASGGPIAWMAFGRGRPEWDAASPPADLARRALDDEVVRLPLDVRGRLRFDVATRTIRAQVTLGPGQATGQLREVGLFAGRASARQDSGVMINHLVHDVVDKDPDQSLRRILELRLPDVLDDDLATALGGLLVGEARAGRLVGIAIGTGTGPGADGGLGDEQLRREFASDEVGYDVKRAVVEVAARFDADDLVPGWPTSPAGAPEPVREIGLVVGDDITSGSVVARTSVDDHDLRRARSLAHRARLSLASSFEVSVPGLDGIVLADVSTRLGPTLLLGSVTEVARPGTVATTVVSQDPVAGTEVPELTRVDVVIVQRRTVFVPNVVGLDTDRARQALARRDLDVRDVAEHRYGVGERGEPAGVVIATGPPAGTVVERESAVALTMAAYESLPVPDVRGRSLESATAVLRRAGFLATPTVVERASSASTGSVVFQEPAPRALRSLDQPIALTLATPLFVEVPDVTGASVSDAAAAIREAGQAAVAAVGRDRGIPGLAMGSVTTVDEPGEPGTVLRQEPVGGTHAPLFGGVDLWIVEGARVPVPDLVGSSEREATRALAAVGLRLGQRATRIAPDEAGNVVGQAPEAGVRLPAASAVDVTVATKETVTVPDLTGFGPDAIVEILASRGLVLGSEDQAVAEGAPGTVGAQQPRPGRVVDAGTGVDVVYVAGVPSLVGLTAEAATRLTSGIGLDIVRVDAPGAGPPETVVAQEPAAGEPVPANGRVQVSVATAVRVEVPDVVRRDPTTATNLLTRAGLVLDLAGHEESDAVAVGQVARQEPAAGVAVDPGISVRVWVRAASDVVVPDVIGRTPGDAQVALADARLVPSFGEPIPTNAVDSGRVAATEPAAGTAVRGGAVVVVRLASAASVAVPDVRSLDPDEAARRLAAAGLGWTSEDSYARSTTFGGQGPQRVVAIQEPRPGSSVPVGSVVSGVLGTAVPKVIGMPGAKAVALLQSFELTPSMSEVVSNQAAGTVVSCAPGVGSPVLRGDKVALNVARSGLVLDDVRVRDRIITHPDDILTRGGFLDDAIIRGPGPIIR